MNGSQTSVGLLGATLIAANFWTSDRDALMPAVSGSGASAKQRTTAHAAFKKLGIEAATVGVMVIIAGISPSAGGLMAAILLGLALVWAFRQYGNNNGGT